MRQGILISSLLIFSILLPFNYASEETTKIYNESAAQQLLGNLSDIFWSSATSYRKFGDDVISPEILLREKFRPYFDEMQKYDWKNFHDPLLTRQFEVILRGAKYPPLNAKFKSATHKLKSMSKQKWVCPHQSVANKKCNMAMVHQIKTVITNSNDLNEIKYYWSEWRNKMPEDIKQSLHYYISYYQNISTPEMKASAIWYDQYEDEHFIKELEELMESVLPFYKELHAHLRHMLRLKYGKDIVPASGLIPHHLLEQVIYQAWKKESVLINPFPKWKLPNLQADMDELGYKPFDLVNMSAQFFGSLGFQNLSSAFMKEHFVEIEAGTAGPDCKSIIFDFGEIEMKYCPKVYYKKLLQTHGDMTHIQYAMIKNNMSIGLNWGASPGFGSAMGEAIILSVSNPNHLQNNLGLLKDYTYDDILNLNRLFRLAVHTLLTIPTYYVHEKLWVDMIDGNVSPSEYNCHYWNLMQKYMGVEAPEQTNANAYDMPYKFYEGVIDQFRSTKKLFGEFLGYQIYRAICLKIGEFERGNAYKVLNNCDFANNKQAGDLLRDMMSAGSSKTWREIIKPLTIMKRTKLSATAFLEYFEPLHTWISDDNVEENLHVGWQEPDTSHTPAPQCLHSGYILPQPTAATTF